MKKLFLGNSIGLAIVAPIAAIVSCSEEAKKIKNTIIEKAANALEKAFAKDNKPTLRISQNIALVSTFTAFDFSQLKGIFTKPKGFDNYGVTLKYKHAAITIATSGDIDITFEISKKGFVAKQITIKIAISVFIAANQDISNAITKLENDFGTTNKQTLATASTINEVSDFQAFDFSQLKGVFSKPDGFDSHGVTLKYKHGIISANGDKEITFQVSKSGGVTKEKVITIAVTGFDAAANTSIQNAISALESSFGIGNKQTLATTTSIPATSTFQAFDFSQLKGVFSNQPHDFDAYGVTLKYKHGVINANGDKEITFEVSKSGGVTKEKVITIAVTGFDAAANTSIQDAISALESSFGTLSKQTLLHDIAIPAVSTFQAFDFSQLEGVFSTNKPVDFGAYGVTLKYKHGVINTNGDKQITFEVSKSGGAPKEKVITIAVTGFDVAANTSIQDAISALETSFGNLNKQTLSHDTTIPAISSFQAFDFSQLEGVFTKPSNFDDHGVTLKYKHGVINTNGDKQITFEVSKSGGAPKEKVITIAVTGFDAASNTSIQDAISALETSFGNLNKQTLLHDTTIPAISSFQAFDFSQLEGVFTKPSNFDDHGVTLKYKHEEISANGDKEITFEVSKSGGTPQEKVITIAITGLDIAANTAIQNAIDDLESSFGIGNKQTLAATSNILAVSTFQAFDFSQLEGVFTKPSNFVDHGVTLKYKHEEMSASGDKQITFEVSKSGGAPKEKIITINFIKNV